MTGENPPAGSRRGAGWAWLVVTAAAALAERILLFTSYPPVAYHDTASYRRLAAAILAGWNGYDGTRSPGYPLFLAWLGSDQAVYAAQLLLGLLTTIIFCLTGWLATRSLGFAAAAGLAHTLNLGQLFFEANLLTETLTTFWLALALLGVTAWVYLPGWRGRWLALAAGTAAAAAGQVRPLFVLFPGWVAVFLAATAVPVDAPAQLRALPAWLSRRRLRFLAWGLLPAVILVGGWMGYIYKNFHVVGVTSMQGYYQMQHAGVFFELVPDQYAAVRDVYLKYRARQVAQYQSPGNAIWDAIPELEKVSGLNFYGLSRLMGQISTRLLWAHPDLYARNLLEGWWMFWRAPVYWSAQNIANILAQNGLAAAVTLERYLLASANLFFVSTSLLALFWRRGRAWLELNAWLAFLAVSVWMTSIAQTFLDHGDNPRFLVPLQTFVVLWCLWIATILVKKWKIRLSKLPTRS